MKFCQNCGNELFDEAVMCPKCGQAQEPIATISVSTEQANAAISPTAKATQKTVRKPMSPKARKIMKFEKKTGKRNIDETVGCDFSIEQTADENSSEIDEASLDIIKHAKITNIIAIVVLLSGIVSFVFINGWLGAVLCLLAELIALRPNTKLLKHFIPENPTTDKKTLRADKKALQKELKSKNKDYKFSFVLGYVALAGIIIALMLPSPLVNMNKPVKSANTSTATENASNKESATGSTAASSADKYAKEPIVGSFDYSKSYDNNAKTTVSPSLPYINHLYFKADGTGNMTFKTSGSSGFETCATCTITWEVKESTEQLKVYVIQWDEDQAFVYYSIDDDLCYTITNDEIANFYTRYSGNAKDNVSGATTGTAYKIIGSYRFSHAYNPGTENRISNPSLPYTYYLTFCEGNSCLVQAKTNSSSNAYGLEFYNGKWDYEKRDGEFYVYNITLDKGGSMSVYYTPDDNMCVVSDTNGIYYYLERVED